MWSGGSWSTLASDIFDCCYLAKKLLRGGVYTFRTACVNKAGMGPYSSPSEQVLLGGPDHLGEPLQDLAGGGWGSLWNCHQGIHTNGEDLFWLLHCPSPSPNGPRNEKLSVGLRRGPLPR